MTMPHRNATLGAMGGGLHHARRQTDFLPIVDQVQFLHRQGFVHGDIRAYSTVFNSDEDDDSNFLKAA